MLFFCVFASPFFCHYVLIVSLFDFLNLNELGKLKKKKKKYHRLAVSNV